VVQLLTASAVVALLAVLVLTVGLGPSAVATGVAVTAGGSWWFSRSLAAHGVTRLGPADAVTLVRAVLVVGVSALVVEGGHTAVLLPLTATALTLDLVDGAVARRTGTASAFGASLDMEVDALLILVLSVLVAPEVGWWVLLIGLARYLLGLAATLMPVLKRPVPVRRWAKVVAAVQGVALLAVAAGLPTVASQALLAVALLLLVESFTHQVRWLLTHPPVTHPAPVAEQVAA
jgi:phosphatidylglycerophosphate synthase